jgi:FtsP/CotA-like multicopper oxidase with cupredoxin domain
MVSRRTFLKGLAAAGAALVLPPTLTDNAEAARRFWALDSTHLSDPAIGMPTGQMGGRPPSPYDTIHLTDASCSRPGDVLRITVPGVWETPDEYVVVESVLEHGLVSVRRA